MNQLQTQIYQILQQNAGNRLTAELIAGLTTTLHNVADADKKNALEQLSKENKDG